MPICIKAGIGDPVVVTVNDPAVPTVKVVLLALVIVGAVPAAVAVMSKKLLFACPPVPELPVIRWVPVPTAEGV
jgi:hypothetical protein